MKKIVKNENILRGPKLNNINVLNPFNIAVAVIFFLKKGQVQCLSARLVLRLNVRRFFYFKCMTHLFF
jgi:hypothetical protein